MNNDIRTRLQKASEAWARLFKSSRPVNQDQSNTQQQQQSRQTTIVLTQANTIRNNPWGDRLQQKDDNITRMYVQNVNGIKIQNDGGQMQEICSTTKEVQADIVCLQEHNLDTTRCTVRHICCITPSDRHMDTIKTHHGGQFSNPILKYMETRGHGHPINDRIYHRSP
jgi:hypothetical protein